MTEEEKNKALEDEDLLKHDDIEDDGEDEEEKIRKEKEEAEKQERARQARLRREREEREREEREARIRKQAKLEGELEASKVNTYTNEPIEDEYDLKIFKLQKELEKEGKDPISDLPKKLAEMERSASREAKKKKEAEEEVNKVIDDDIKDFKSKYPNVDLVELLKDPDFKDYTDGRLGIKGGMSLATIYDNFNKFKAKYSKSEEKEEDAEKATPPSPNGGRKSKKLTYSEMSKEEKIKELKRQGLIK
jgi:hypothetical protein